MTKKVCISGYYGFDNFGDETILKILVENIKNFEQVSQITVFSSNPHKTSKQLEVNSVYSFNPKDIFHTLANSDYLISGGGSLLQDATSIKSLIYYLGILCLAQLFKKKTIIFAQGIGPINNKLAEKITKFILKNSSYVTVRDDRSLNLLKDWNIDAIKCSDPVWNISNIENKKTNKLGVQLRSFPTLNSEFIKQLAISINENYSHKEINILSLQNSLDLGVCNKLKEELIIINPSIDAKVIENTSCEEIINHITELDEFIAMRYHACLIAIKAGIKLLPINYDIKVETLAKEFNLETLNLNSIQETNNIIKNFKNTQCRYDKKSINGHQFNFKALESII